MSLIRRFADAMLRPAVASVFLALFALTALPICARAQQGGEENGPWVAPERAARRANPLPVAADAVKHGRELFERECAKCHGKLGHGDGPQAPHLEIRPQDLTAEAVTSQTDGALFWKITEGRGPMPKAKLNDNEKWQVIHYLRSLPRKQ